MNNDYFLPSGDEISSNDLTIKEAIAMFSALAASPFAEVISVLRSQNDTEILIADIDIEVPQHPKFDVRSMERIAITFHKDFVQLPMIGALRRNFPLVPHRILTAEGLPLFLCLYTSSEEEIKVTWTAANCLFRIRSWFQLTALNQLHQIDQVLEPLLIEYDGSILFDSFEFEEVLNIYQIGTQKGFQLLLYATKRQLSKESCPIKLEFIAGEVQTHGFINRKPENLADLSKLLDNASVGLNKFLVEKLKGILTIDNRRLALCITLPKKRFDVDTTATVSDHFVFITSETLTEIAKEIELIDIQQGYIAPVIGAEPNFENLKNITIGVFRPVFPYNRDLALRLSDLQMSEGEKRIVLIGAGALGSQIAIGSIRSGIGKWVMFDSDILDTHNIARHALFNTQLLKNKAMELAKLANTIIKDSSIGYDEAIIDGNEKVEQEVSKSEITIDASASSAALKSIAHIEKRSRIVSFSLNPSGSDFVMFGEDEAKLYWAPHLECQYLRMILNLPALHDHFKLRNEKFRYGMGCRDITLLLPQENISLFASISVKKLKHFIKNDDASLSIHRINELTSEVGSYTFPIYPTLKFEIAGWKIFYDQYVVDKLHQRRKQKLNNETGGMLLGNYDMLRNEIFIIDLLLSPSDSLEYPSSYIRGTSGVHKELKNVDAISAGAIKYIGEWHSHPIGFSTEMSQDDQTLMKWLKANMADEGYPALMVIVGDEEQPSFYIE